MGGEGCGAGNEVGMGGEGCGAGDEVGMGGEGCGAGDEVGTGGECCGAGDDLGMGGCLEASEVAARCLLGNRSAAGADWAVGLDWTAFPLAGLAGACLWMTTFCTRSRDWYVTLSSPAIGVSTGAASGGGLGWPVAAPLAGAWSAGLSSDLELFPISDLADVVSGAFATTACASGLAAGRAQLATRACAASGLAGCLSGVAAAGLAGAVCVSLVGRGARGTLIGCRGSACSPPLLHVIGAYRHQHMPGRSGPTGLHTYLG
jgi:hypothetical protein